MAAICYACRAFVVVCAWLFLTSMAWGQEPAPSTPTAIEVRIEDATNANALAAALYGAPATPKAGDVAGGDKVANLAQLMQPRAYEKIAVAVQSFVGTETTLLTNRTNIGALMQGAQDVSDALRQLEAEGESFDEAQTPDGRKALIKSVPQMLSRVAELDSIIGMFRADYSISAADLDANTTGLMLAVQRRCGSKCMVDNLDLVAKPNAEFARVMAELGRLRMTVAAKASTDDKGPEAAFVKAVDTTLASLRTMGADGLTPAARIHSLLNLKEKNPGVIYLGVIAPKATAVTSKRMLSRNHRVHLHFTALVNVIAQKACTVSQTGALGVGGVKSVSTVACPAVQSATLRIGERATLDLRELARYENELDVATDGIEEHLDGDDIAVIREALAAYQRASADTSPELETQIKTTPRKVEQMQ